MAWKPTQSGRLTAGLAFRLRGKLLLAATLFLVLLSGRSFAALTVSASPNPAQLGQQVAVSIYASDETIPPFCVLQVDYGDNTTGWSGTCTQVPCQLNSTHTYSTPGVFAITARTMGGLCFGYQEASTSIAVQCAPLQISTNGTLPNGNVGLPAYNKQIQATGGQPQINFSLSSGTLPPGLSLTPSGLLSGKATHAGNYSFTVKATDSCPGGAQSQSKAFSLTIKPPFTLKEERFAPPSKGPPRATATMKAVLPKPDLVVCITGGDFHSKPIGSVDVKGVVKNIGNADAGPFSVSVYCGEWGSPSGWVRAASFTGLIQGDESPWTYERTYTFQGTKSCTVWIDKENDVDEGPNNDNNKLRWDFYVGLTKPRYMVNPSGTCSNQ